MCTLAAHHCNQIDKRCCALQAHTNDPALPRLLKSLIASQQKLAIVPAALVVAGQLEPLQNLIGEAELQKPEAAKLTVEKLRNAADKLGLFKQMSTQVFGLQPGATAVISNGRMLVDFDPSAGEELPLHAYLVAWTRHILGIPECLIVAASCRGCASYSAPCSHQPAFPLLQCSMHLSSPCSAVACTGPVCCPGIPNPTRLPTQCTPVMRVI